MNDTHTHICHRMEFAKKTGDQQASQRGYAFDPEETEKTPYAFWIVVCVLGLVGFCLIAAASA